MLKNKKTRVTVFGVIIMIVGVMIGIVPTFLEQKEEIKKKDKVNQFLLHTSSFSNITTASGKINTNNKESEPYFLILEIPKISLQRGVYAKTSKLNSIEYNVSIMEESSMPTDIHHNIILAAHNGDAKIAYFNQLYKLEIGDIASIYHEGVKYTYQVNFIYDVLKDGTVEITRDLEKETLTLITCKKNTKDRQLVLILYLNSKENY